MIEYVTYSAGIVKKKEEANFKVIGPKFGKSVKQVAERIKEMSAAEITELERSGSLLLPMNGSSFTIGKEDIEIVREDIQGWLVESDGVSTVALDTELTDALLEEGNAREFVNRVQNMRKDAGFVVTDRIVICYKATPAMDAAIQAMAGYIKNETLAVELLNVYRAGEYSSVLEINGETVEVGIERKPSH